MTEKPWPRLKEDALLDKRIKDLSLSIAASSIRTYIQKLYEELSQKGLKFHPPCFLADEWFCPVGIPAIGIPFFLTHPRLRSLEQKFILEVEGGSKTEFMKLIRHEAGHAYSYAYSLHKKTKWRRLFGSPSEEYTETYHPRPYSRSFVIHLDNWYAQSHPDEDFAETFAVWLTPGLRWRKKYRGWRALQKLEYLDTLMRSVADKPPKNIPKFNPHEYSGLGIKLKTFYQRKCKYFEESYPDFYDKDLKTLFTDVPEEKSDVKASRYLKNTTPKLLKAVSFWTKEKKYTIDQLIKNLVERTGDLNLYVRKGQTDLDVQMTTYITSLVTNYLFTGKFKRSK